MTAQEQGTVKKSHFVLRLFGWVFGALSLLNLIKDLNFIELYGSIRDWVTAYTMLVSTVGHFLFGWIHWRWIRIDAEEHHVLVLAALIAGTVGRAYYATLLRRNSSNAAGDSVGIAFVFMLFAFVAVLLIPSPASLWLGGLLLVFMCIGSLIKDEKQKDRDVEPADFGRELVVVGAVFLAVVLANYLIFKP